MTDGQRTDKQTNRLQQKTRPDVCKSDNLSAKRSDFSDLLGKKFRYGGRGPDEYDCYGLCMEIYRRLGRKLPDFGSAVQAHVIDGMIGEGRELFTQIPKPEPFCLVTFMLRPPFTSHIGVALPDGYRFIHILARSRVTIERLDSQTWKRKITGYFRLPEDR